MTRLTYLVAGAALLFVAPAPAIADDDRRDGYNRQHHSNGYGKRHRGYRGDHGRRAYRYVYHYPRSYRYAYPTRSYRYSYGYGDPYGYGRPYYDYGSSYGYHRPYYRYRGHRYRCDDGATGAILGGVAGALIGRGIDRSDGRSYRRYRYRRGDGTTGAIIGGAIGAVVGHEIARDC